MKKYFLLLVLVAVAGCGRHDYNEVPPQVLSEIKQPEHTVTNGVIGEKEEEEFIPSFHEYSTSTSQLIFFYPQKWTFEEHGNDILLKDASSTSSDAFMKVSLLQKGVSLPFLQNRDLNSLFQAQNEHKISEVTVENNHARFLQKDSTLGVNIIHHYFLKNDGVVGAVEYREDVPKKKAVEQGLLYFSFVDDWVTYKNSEYGFSLKYPSGWNVEEMKDFKEGEGPLFPLKVYISKLEKDAPATEYSSPYVEIDVTNNSFTKTKKQIEDADIHVEGRSLSEISNIKNFTLNKIVGKKALESTGLGIPIEIYYFPLKHSTKGLWISYNERGDGKEFLVEKIISTLHVE